MLFYRLSLALVFIWLIQIVQPASAEWVPLEPSYQLHPLQTAYLDSSTIHREGNLVTLSALIDWKAMQGGRSPTRFYSTVMTKQFDCVTKLVRTVATTDFYGHMGTGEVIGGGIPANESQWKDIDPKSLNQGLWEAACMTR